MANVLSLRTAPASILKLDAAFFEGSVLPLLQKRGYDKTDLKLDVDGAGLEKLLSGKDIVPPGSITASASTWRALLVAAEAREQAKKGARDVGGETVLKGKSQDFVRQKNGKRVKARPRGAVMKLAPAPTTPTTTAPTAAVTDPAAFAVQNLARLATLVVDRIRNAADGAAVVVNNGELVVDGTVVGRLT